MFDTTIFEKITSIMMLFTMPMVGFMPAMLFISIALLSADGTMGYAVALSGGCCSLVVGLVFSLALLLMMKRSRSGRARPFLEEASAQLPGTEIVLGSLLWSLLSPRLKGEVDGHEFRLTFRRQGGILSAADIGSRFLTFGWMYDLVLTLPWTGNAGFSPEAMPNIGLSLFGISGPTEVQDGVKTYSCKNEAGERLVVDQQAIDSAREAVKFGRHGALLRVKPDAIRVSGHVPDGLTPDQLVAFLKHIAALATRAKHLA